MLEGLGFRIADGADLGRSEYRSRREAVIDRPWLVAELAVGEGMALADCSRREVEPVGYVADGEDCIDARARRPVDGDVPIPAAFDTRLLEAHAGGVGDAPGGEHDRVRRHRTARIEVR